MLAGKFHSCGALFGSIMAGSDVEERDGRTRHYISTEEEHDRVKRLQNIVDGARSWQKHQLATPQQPNDEDHDHEKCIDGMSHQDARVGESIMLSAWV